jgi:Ca-activated chloride channel family protein
MLGEKKRSYLLVSLKWLAILLAISALASPVFVKEYSDSKKDGRDIVLIVDTSDSMRERGFDPANRHNNKFDVVKEVAASFVEKRQNDRVALITFADIAFVASPLTFETEFLQQIIGMQRLGIAGKRTAINDALIQSYSMLEKSKAKTKVVILLTDGIDNVSQVTTDEVVSLVEKSKVKLYTIGIGTQRDFDGAYLKRLAKAGKGEAYGARNSEMLEKIYDEIDRLEVSEIEDKKVVQHTYLFMYPLIFAILILFFFIYFRTMRSL